MFGMKPRNAKQISRYCLALGIDMFHLNIIDDIVEVWSMTKDALQATLCIEAQHTSDKCKQVLSVQELTHDMEKKFHSNRELVNLDFVAQWSKVRKPDLLKTLRYSYMPNVDFFERKAQNPSRRDPRNNNYIEAYITWACFKQLCLQSRNAHRHVLLDIITCITNVPTQV